MGKLNNEEEPVRLNGWVALIVGLGLLAMLGWSLGSPPEAIVAQVVVVALSSIGGLEFARKHSWSEASHNRSLYLTEQTRSPESGP